MTDDEILAELATHGRSHPTAAEPLGPALDRVARGDTSDEALADVASEHGVDAELTRTALRPLDREHRQKTLEKVLAARAAVAKPPPKLTLVAAPSAPVAAAPAGRRIPWSVVGGVTTALALAAAAMLWVGPKAPVDPWPAYAFSASGADKTMRGADDGGTGDPLHLRTDSTLTLLMRPHDRVGGAVEAHVVIVTAGAARVWPGALEISDDGAVRLRAPATALFPAGAGAYEVIVVVSRHGGVANDAAEIAKLATGDRDGTSVGRVRVEVVAGP